MADVKPDQIWRKMEFVSKVLGQIQKRGIVDDDAILIDAPEELSLGQVQDIANTWRNKGARGTRVLQDVDKPSRYALAIMA